MCFREALMKARIMEGGRRGDAAALLLLGSVEWILPGLKRRNGSRVFSVHYIPHTATQCFKE
jgi:hypothetical protein